MRDYIPSMEAEFDAWVENFFIYIGAHDEHLGFQFGELDQLTALKPEWTAAYAAHKAAQAAALGATSVKDARKDALTECIRGLVKRIQAYPATTDVDRAAMGLHIPGSAMETASVDILADRPVPIIDSKYRQMHAIRVKNMTESGVSNARPAWAEGCEIWRKVGDMPAGPQDLQYVCTLKSGTRTIEYTPEDAGKQAHYMLRWVSPKGETGPWTDTESVTIAA